MMLLNTAPHRPVPPNKGSRVCREALLGAWRGWLGVLVCFLGLNTLLLPVAAQASEPLQALEPGTVVTLLPPDLIGAYATAVVGADHRLVFDSTLDPETEVRVLIMPPGAKAAPSPPYGRVSPSGDDIYIQFDGAVQAVSLRYWLAETYGVDLVFTPNVQGVP